MGHFNRRLSVKFIGVVLIIFLLFLYPSLGNSQQTVKIAILPFAINSLENLDPLKEGLMDMLSSRIHVEWKVTVLDKLDIKRAADEIKGEIGLEAAKKVGHRVGADFVLFGSLTKVGENVSLDGNLVDLKSGKIISVIFVQGQGLDHIVPKVGEFAQKVHEKILGQPVQTAKAQPAEERPPVPPAAPIPAPREDAPLLKSLEATPSRITQDFWMSEALPLEVKGMGLGDVDGDGKNEIVLIDRNNLWIYRWEGEMKLMKKIPGHISRENLAVDLADINKNGKAEIFVTSLRKNKLESFVLEHEQGEYKIIASDLDWHLRIVDLPQQGVTLLGQQSSLDNPFYGPIHEMGWDGKEYVKRKKLSFPKNMNIYGLAVVQFRDGGPVHYLYIDEGQYLTLVSQEGKVLWKSNNRFGTNNFIIGKPKITTSMVEESDWIPVNARVLVEDIKGKKEVFLPHNSSLSGQFIKKVKLYNKGEIQRLSWNGTIMDLNWRSKEIGGYIADCQIADLDGDQKKELVGAVVLWGDLSLTGSNRSAIVAYKQ